MLEVIGITKSYGDRRVLDGVDLRVEPGEICGFVGGNGAGKTTTMRITLGIATADSGEVRFAGTPFTDAHRARCGYMPEERGLYPTMAVQQQLEFFARLRGLNAQDATSAADYWIQRLGLEQRRTSALEDLSLGNQQRVQLAVALVHEPDLLVLDEPFSGLDPVAVDTMAAILREEADRGVPVLFSSHQLDLMEKVCDRVTVLANGKVVASGTLAELTGHDGSYLVRTAEPVDSWRHAFALQDGETITIQGDDAIVQLSGAERRRELITAVTARADLLELRPWRPSLTEMYRQVVRDGRPGTPDDATEEEAA